MFLRIQKKLTSKENEHYSSDRWVEYRKKRYELILDIHSRKKIPVQDTRHLRDIVNIGIKVKQANEIIQALKRIFKGNNFTISKSSENSDELNCSATFENTTGYYLNMCLWLLKLIIRMVGLFLESQMRLSLSGVKEQLKN